MASGAACELLKLLLTRGRLEVDTVRPFIEAYINSSGKSQRIEFLKKCFDIKDKDAEQLVVEQGYPGEYSGGAIVLDLLEEAATHAVKKGLSCQEICAFLSCYVACLDLVAGSSNDDKAPSMTTALQRLQQDIILEHHKHMSPSSFKLLMQFVTESVFQHFHLYQFLLTRPQTTDLTTLDLSVETTAGQSFLGLHEATTEEAWFKAKREEELKWSMNNVLEHLEAAEIDEKCEAEDNLEEAYKTLLADFSSGPKKVPIEQLSSIIETLVEAYVKCSIIPISQQLTRQDINTCFELERLELLAAHNKEAHNKETGGHGRGSVARSSLHSSLAKPTK